MIIPKYPKRISDTQNWLECSPPDKPRRIRCVIQAAEENKTLRTSSIHYTFRARTVTSRLIVISSTDPPPTPHFEARSVKIAVLEDIFVLNSIENGNVKFVCELALNVMSDSLPDPIRVLLIG